MPNEDIVRWRGVEVRGGLGPPQPPQQHPTNIIIIIIIITNANADADADYDDDDDDADDDD